jgi:uroporphyrinogen-III synthase
MGPVTSATLNKLGGKPARESAASTLDSLVETLVELSLESRHANE